MTSRPPIIRRRPAAALLLAAVMLAGVATPALATPPERMSRSLAPEPQALVLTHGPRSGRAVALTFDDGYDAPVCSALVDELVTTATPATFFPNARHVVRSPALWRRIADLGFPIGNHTMDHPLMTRLGYAEQVRQIASDRAALERVTGRPSLLVFRPPYGAYNATTLAAAAAAGYRHVLNWDASFADSSRRRDGRPWPDEAYVRAASRGRGGSVILGHCGNAIDVAMLRSVVSSYRARGFTFVTVPELLGLPGARPMRFDTPVPAPAPAPGRRPVPVPADPPSPRPLRPSPL